MTTEVNRALHRHLIRADGQEDVCFAIWYPSQGRTRTSAVLASPVLPDEGDRHVHGNASFEDAYFLRAGRLAAEAGGGLALLHSHPGGRGWQAMSTDDERAEQSHVAQAAVLTGVPLLGLTLGTGNLSWSARFWVREGLRSYRPRWCESVRVVGDRLSASFNETLLPAPKPGASQARTVSAWGETIQADLARLRVGVVGSGSVGAIVGEALAKVGVQRIVLMDFDTVKRENLDRLVHATSRDAALRRAKVHTLARGLRRSATAAATEVRALELSVVEDLGFREALDCDILFSCVDRPWPRAALNLIAYAHLVPVVDGGISVDVGGGHMRGAEWRAHVAAPGRRCLECLVQYDPGLVQAERDGLLDDPTYLKNLPPNHPLRRNENVFPFSLATAGAEVLQMLSLVVAPGGVADPGAQLFHFVTGTVERDERVCDTNCLYSGPLLARGDVVGVNVTGRHQAAERERAGRVHAGRQRLIRAQQILDDLLWRLR